MDNIQAESSFKAGQKVSITRLEDEGYKDEGEVVSASDDKVSVKITKSDLKEVEGTIILFGYRNRVWNYITENGTYSTRDEGYNIVVIS